jgi:hypothetical protein
MQKIKNELEFKNLLVKDADDIVALVDKLKEKISEIVLENTLVDKLTETIENVLKKNKTFEISYSINGKIYRKTISYQADEYDKYQDLFNDDRKFKYYIMVFEWLNMNE